ncbi:hypothetical protein [Adhaeribacter aerolatus]|uniref:hypothetical protein n=1 Tax=Adhaeribacter aerolatus TaxID=670289 RepID=UPI001478352C|nr:hypothetical protein [Adhaeribacter aerolatus]
MKNKILNKDKKTAVQVTFCLYFSKQALFKYNRDVVVFTQSIALKVKDQQRKQVVCDLY